MLAFSAAFTDDDIDNRRKELESIKKDIDKNRSEIKKLSSRESNLMNLLKRLDNDIALITRYMKKLDDQELALKKDVNYTEFLLNKTSGNLDERKSLLKKRIRNIYKKGRYDDLDLLFNSASVSDYLRRNAFFRYIADSDRALIKGITKKQTEYENIKNRLENRLSDVHAVRNEREKEQISLEKQKNARAKVLNEVKGKKGEYTRQVRELEQRQAEINKIIAALQSARRKKTAVPLSANFGEFGKLRGSMPWPVKGNIIKPFGTNIHPVYKTRTVNNGVDFETDDGAPVISVANGEVAYTGVLGSFGNIVIIEHSDGFYTLYANLEKIRVKKGEKVGAKSIIGSTGSTSSIDGAKLHFELRRERSVMDPTNWLE